MATPDMEIIGTTGLQHAGGYIDEEFLLRLRGQRAVRVYREMRDNCAIIGSIFYAITSLIRQVEWRIEPASEDERAVEWAEFVDGCRNDMSHTWDDLITEALSMLWFGWSYHELVYKFRRGASDDPTKRSKFNDGRIGWRKIPIRGQESLLNWDLDPEDNSVRGLFQQDVSSGHGTVLIPIEKALLFRINSSKNNPEGRSVLRNSVRSYHFLKRIQEIEAIGIERDLAGYPVMEVPMEILSKNPSAGNMTVRNHLEKLIQQIKRDEREGALIPSELDREGKPTGFKLKLLTTGGSRQIDTDKTVVRYETRIAQTVMADFVMLGMNATGSFALASSKTNLFAISLNTVMNQITSVFNRFAIPRLMAFNGVPEEFWPTLEHGDLEQQPLDEVSGYITSLTAQGLVKPTDALERKLLEFGGLPQPELDETPDPAPVPDSEEPTDGVA